MPPEIEVEDAGPDKGQEATCKVPNEPHENREVGNENCKDDGDQDYSNPVCEAPDLQLPVQGPD